MSSPPCSQPKSSECRGSRCTKSTAQNPVNDGVLISGSVEAVIPPTHSEFWNAYIMIDAIRKLWALDNDIRFEIVRDEHSMTGQFTPYKTSFLVHPCSADNVPRKTLLPGQQHVPRGVNRFAADDAGACVERRTGSGIEPTETAVVRRCRIVVVQYVNPSVELSASDGLKLFELFYHSNLLVVVRRAVYMVVGPAATLLLEHLMGMKTFEMTEPPQAGAVPKDLVFPAQWAYDQPEFVRLHNPSSTVLMRMDFRRTYRCEFVALGSKRTDLTAGTDATMVAIQINSVMRRLAKRTPRVDDADYRAAFVLVFEPSDSSAQIVV